MEQVIAFQGERGAYSEAALVARFGPEATPWPCASFDRLFAAVASGEAALGVVPIENSLAGSVLENYDLLLANDLPIVGELALNVRHCLLAAHGTRLEDLRVASSHPQALAQSLPFLQAHGITPRAAYDTAGAARELALHPEPGAAAVASARAAAIYGLSIVAEGIQTRDDNTTRFFVIAPDRPAHLPAQKGSLVFAARNAPGSLYACLGVMARHGINMTKLESRPTRDRPWEYYFYVDLEPADRGVFAAGALEALVGDLAGHTAFARLLGSYPRAL